VPNRPHPILLVDDDPEIRSALTDLLTIAGYGVLEAANGQEALDLLGRPDEPLPCLIVLDIMMPILDGWEFRRRQIADPRLASIPVLVVTADTTAQRRPEARSVQSFLMKPADPDALLQAIGRYC
jgi:two-component system, chemotaxis family, chemotaxis protein CheY